MTMSCTSGGFQSNECYRRSTFLNAIELISSILFYHITHNSYPHFLFDI